MQVEALFKAHKDVLRQASYRDDAMQSIRNNIRWLESNGAAVCAWLKTGPPPTMHMPSLEGAAQAPARAPAWAPAVAPRLAPAPGPGVELFVCSQTASGLS